MLTRIAKGLVSLSEFIKPQVQGSVEAPEQGDFLSGQRDDLSVTRSVRRSNNPERLAATMSAADEGDVSAQMEVFEEVERDPRIARLTKKRRDNVLGNDLVIKPADDDPKSQQAADLCNEMIFGSENYNGVSNLKDGLFNLSDAIFKGFAVVQPQWTHDNGKIIPVRFNQWAQREFKFGSSYAQYKQDHDDIRVLTDASRNDGEQLSKFPNGQWIVHVQKCWSQPISRAALARSVTWFWMFKRHSYRDFNIFLERFGIPMRKGTYSDRNDPKEREELWQAVKGLGKDHCCIMPEGSTIELIELHGTTGEAPHPSMIKHCNEEIDIAIMGSTMSVTQGDKGARSAKEAFTNDEHEQTKSDASKLGETLSKQLCEPIIKYNLGEGYRTPTCFFQLADNDNLETRSKVDKTLHEMNYPITYGYISDKYSLPLPEKFDRDEVLESAPEPTPNTDPDETVENSLALAEKKKSVAQTIMQKLQLKGG